MFRALRPVVASLAGTILLVPPSSLGVPAQAAPAAVFQAVATSATIDQADPLAASAAAPQAFRHPGVLVNRLQLDFMRRQVLAGAQPQKRAYDAMRASRHASLSWSPRPRAVVECGPASMPDKGCTDERGDAMAAYTHALLWYVTRDGRHAQKAIQIMDAWSAVLRDHTNHNARLQAGWAGASFSRAGEIIRYTYTGGWGQVKRFATMLRTAYLPEIRNGGGCTNGNWELIMTDALIGVGVFLEDRAAFDKAVSLWRGRVPGYVYLTTDGSQPKSPSTCAKRTRSQIVAYWQGQDRFVDGLAQETCRDFGHTGWGLAAAAHVAETALHQGVDLYAEQTARMTAAAHFHTRYETGESVPSWLCKGRVQRGLGPTTEVLYNHFHNRRGMDMPTTQRYTESERPAGLDYFLGWETLTHANNPR